MMLQKPDRLSALIQRFRISAKVLSSGGPRSAGSGEQFGENLMILRRGQVALRRDGSAEERLNGPALVYWPGGFAGKVRIETGPEDTEFIFAYVETGGEGSPIALALPEIVIVPLARSSPLQAIADLLLEEALDRRCGGGAVIDRLCEVLVIRLLRHLIEDGDAQAGLLAGLGHPNLSLAIVAIHEKPERAWRLEDLAEIAAMSRTRFATTFREVVGVTPGEYLSSWRLTLARMEISRKTPLKIVAGNVGFSGPAALSRAFTRRYGLTPRQVLVGADACPPGA